MALIAFFFLILVATVVIPQYVVILLVLNLCVGLFLSIFQIVSAFLPRFIPKQKEMSTEPFVSVLIPTYNEPPAILMQTLEKLSLLAYRNYEVLVMDNNTKDQAIWKPVEVFVSTLGDTFRFFHHEHMTGFKAGALNYLLQRTHLKSEYIAVIDADYLVEPHFLATALGYFIEEDIAIVQFPQHYRNVTKEN